MTSDADAPSRTARKKASEALQNIGEQLLELRPERFAALPLPETLREAILDAKRVRGFEAKRRQVQYIGKLMRRLDSGTVQEISEALRVEHGVSVQEDDILHQAEQWRDALIADDARLAQWLESYPDTDANQLRALIRAARNEARDVRPEAASRKGTAYRQVLKALRAQLGASAGGTGS